MKIFKITHWSLLSLLMFSSLAYAQPTDFGTSGDTSTNPTDAPTAPINKHLLLLFLSGISFVFYKQLKTKNRNS